MIVSRKLAGIVALCLMWAFGSYAANAPAKKSETSKIVIRVGSVAPEGTPWAMWLNSIKQRMQKQSNRITMKVFLGGKLGGERAMLAETKSGTQVQMFGGSLGAIASKYAPELNVFELPFMFDSDAQVDFVLDKLRPDMASILAKQGFILSMFNMNGWHGYATKNKCITSPADMAGLRMRSQVSNIHLGTYKAFGATPVELPVPDVLSALERGVVDGFSNTMIVAYALGWHRPITHFTYTKHIYQPALMVFSRAWFDRLSPDIQKILLDRSEERRGISEVRALRDPLVENMRAAGVTVCKINESQRAVFRKSARQVWDVFASTSPRAKAILARVLEAKAQYARSQKHGRVASAKT